VLSAFAYSITYEDLMFTKKLFLSLTLVAFTACSKDDTTDATDSGSTDSGSTDSGIVSTDTGETQPTGFSMSGVALDLATLVPAVEGLCIAAADPTKALGGGELEILAGAQIGADGAFLIEGVTTTSAVGLFMVVQDCEGAAEMTVMPTATGVAPSSYGELGDGDALEGLTMLSISGPAAQGMDMSLTGVGYEGGSVIISGLMAGFVRDAEGAAIAGATVSCTTGDNKPCAPVFYADADPTVGGMFASEEGVNGATRAATGGLFIVPGAPIFTYSAMAEGYTFQDQLFGSVPGLATFMTFVAD
jgi:hypothetical protein